jgi:hypothetical protein
MVERDLLGTGLLKGKQDKQVWWQLWKAEGTLSLSFPSFYN